MISEGPNGPTIKLSEDLKNQLCKPWSNALILKVMGRNHTLNFMHAKLRQKWQLIGHWQLTDLEEGYFMVTFQMLDDLEYVLTEGPWVIANQYIVVQKWRPNFVPGEDAIQKMLVWVRLSKLPMECIDVDLLRNIGRMLGTTIKVDPITKSQARDRYARICVEIDITKPFKSSLSVEDHSIMIEYKSLGLFCFKCGKVRHYKDSCREGVVTQTDQDRNAKQGTSVDSSIKDLYGPWMQVTYGINTRNMGSSATRKRGNFQSQGWKAGTGMKHGNGPRC
ncbi:hypothetical protein LWI29_017932 [Acer saccharum]|uniref:CCHC-type domain-containing protein n=1 Tax=Acer saccharum TaxID=4024 RepID=A0AA39RK61_ACESA|nr:hypothetical protein LWI29_017932 [Acer saccharum]